MFEPVYETTPDAVIKVVGVGGGGGNALNHMVRSCQEDDIGSVEFFSVNTDAQVLRSSAVRNTVQTGAGITHGLGAGGDPNIGYQSAEEDREALTNMLSDASMVFIAAGMGGGSGTGASPVIAEIAKSQGALTVAIVTKPFNFEGRKRLNFAEQGIKELAKNVDALIIIQNEKLLKVLPKGVKFKDAFSYADDVLRNAVLGITDMITKEGLVNVDFNDVKTVMSGMGRSMMGTGIAEGEGRAERAAMEAVASPLLEDVDLSGVKGVLINISAGDDLELNEVDSVVKYITEATDPDATIIFGTTFYPEMEGKIRVTLVATGLGQAEELAVPRTGMIQQSPQSTPVPPQGTPVPGQNSGYGNQQPVPTRPGFTQSEPTGYGHSVQQGGNAHQQPRTIDPNQMFSPSAIPGFMRNGH